MSDADFEAALRADRAGDGAGARSGYAAVLRRDPTHLGAQRGLARLALRAGAWEDARGRLTTVLAATPRDAVVRYERARALEGLGRLSEALEDYQAAREGLPAHPDVGCAVANTQVALGDFAAAQVSYRRVLDRNPDHGPTHRQLARLLRFKAASDDRIAAMQRSLERTGLAEEDRLHLHFGLGKAFEDLGRFEEAFEHFAAGNALMRARLRYDLTNWEREVDAVIEAFDTPLLTRLGAAGDAHARPIFIVGMPRSGTTLVEQILAAHPAVRAVGESPAFQKAVMAGIDTKRFPAVVATLEVDDLSAIAAGYRRELGAAAASALRSADKKPDNFRLIGLIRLVFPRAVVVHCVREPMAVGASLYRTLFSDRGPFYSYDLADIGRYHRSYARLMDHWRRWSPGFVHDVSYEALVRDPDATIRTLVAQCGLAWDDACLAPQSVRRGVQTASAVQVRSPIHTAAIDTWRRFGSSLDPLARALAADPGEAATHELRS